MIYNGNYNETHLRSEALNQLRGNTSVKILWHFKCTWRRFKSTYFYYKFIIHIHLYIIYMMYKQLDYLAYCPHNLIFEYSVGSFE